MIKDKFYFKSFLWYDNDRDTQECIKKIEECSYNMKYEQIEFDNELLEIENMNSNIERSFESF